MFTLFRFVAAANGMFTVFGFLAAYADAVQRTFFALFVKTAAIHTAINDGLMFKHVIHLLVLIRGQ